MAFCPECGKQGAADATKCVYCGHETAPRPAAAGGGRFKGTMMMQSAPAAVVPPQAAAPAPAAAPVEVKPNLKGTMLGAGIAPPVAPHGAGAPVEEKRKMAFAATQPQSAAYIPTSISAKPPAAAPAAEPAAEPKKYLPGDPMAPSPSSAKTGSGRFSIDQSAEQPSNKMLFVYAIVGMLVIAGVGVGAAVYMGLLSFK